MKLPIGRQMPLDSILPRETYYPPLRLPTRTELADMEPLRRPRSRFDMLLGVNLEPCPHNNFTNQICDDCGFECTDHNYDKRGQCKVCGFECEHYDYDGHSCLDCGLECHEFLDFDSYGEEDR
jgi:hypothetical protein